VLPVFLRHQPDLNEHVGQGDADVVLIVIVMTRAPADLIGDACEGDKAIAIVRVFSTKLWQ
jgi:hypothetical protein